VRVVFSLVMTIVNQRALRSSGNPITILVRDRARLRFLDRLDGDLDHDVQSGDGSATVFTLFG
jgi:hypothetical protein